MNIELNDNFNIKLEKNENLIVLNNKNFILEQLMTSENVLLSSNLSMMSYSIGINDKSILFIDLNKDKEVNLIKNNINEILNKSIIINFDTTNCFKIFLEVSKYLIFQKEKKIVVIKELEKNIKPSLINKINKLFNEKNCNVVWIVNNISKISKYNSFFKHKIKNIEYKSNDLTNNDKLYINLFLGNNLIYINNRKTKNFNIDSLNYGENCDVIKIDFEDLCKNLEKDKLVNEIKNF